MRGIQDNQYAWIVEVFLVVFITLSVAYIAKRFIGHLAVKAEKTATFWDDCLFQALLQPASSLVWLLGLCFAAQMAGRQTESVVLDAIPVIREVASIFLFCWFLVSFTSKVEKNVVDPLRLNKPMDPTTAGAVGKLIRSAIIITSVLVVLQSLGYSISGVLAFGGIGGIAVGFAAKDLLANFFGGVMIYLDRPFKVGEWIRSPDKDIEGTVEEIGWRLTRIRTFDKRPLFIPNSTFTQISVENPSRMTNRRIYETIGIRYGDAAKMSAIVDQVSSMIHAHQDLDSSQTIIVNFNKFAASSLDFFIYCFTKTTNWVEFHAIKQDVLLKVIEIVEGSGAQCAFPTSTIHIPEALVTKMETS